MSDDHDQRATETFDRKSSLGYQVNHLARLLARSLRARIEQYGVVPGQFAQLVALYEEDGLTQTELLERVRIEQSTLAHTLKRMERDGLIRREQDGEDRRRFRIYLTPHALELKPRLLGAATDVNALALETMPESDSDQVLALLERLIANLEADPEANGQP
ncbi:MAG: MarR family transcriptional regulator [Actinobacteria bacterium]|nr:MarR family transcriptional regulator [Actinomycetota bacterium]